MIIITKLQTKEVFSGVIHHYLLDNIQTLDDFRAWLAKVFALEDVSIRSIKYIAGNGQLMELTELPRTFHISNTSVVSITLSYHKAAIALTANCESWTISMLASKQDQNQLEDLADRIAA